MVVTEEILVKVVVQGGRSDASGVGNGGVTMLLMISCSEKVLK